MFKSEQQCCLFISICDMENLYKFTYDTIKSQKNI